jgi:ATP-dependent Clp protease adaptor protein ClpS
MPDQRDDHGTRTADPELLTEERTETRRPRRFQVLLHNDDFTTMQFVVEVLTRYFNKSATVATQIMLEVHMKGTGVAGVFTRDVAETKVEQVMAAARDAGFPLRLSIEPE